MFTFVQLRVLGLYMLVICVCYGHGGLTAQTNDSPRMNPKRDSLSVKKAIYSSARKATIMSACLPGLGQAYNKRYWKIPLVYAAMGGLGYWAMNNQKQYKYYSNNLHAMYDNDPVTINTTIYNNPEQLVTQKKYYKKYRDMAFMLGALVYVLNIIDANVDAHLNTFDVSDELSIRLQPYSTMSFDHTLQTGLALKLNFK